MNPTQPPTNPTIAGGGSPTSGSSSSATGPDATPASGRRTGHLYLQVAKHLADHPDTVWKVRQVTAAIGAPSSGAVFEALKRMAAAGYATWHTGPHRFQVTAAGIAAAGALPPPLPRTGRTGRTGRTSGTSGTSGTGTGLGGGRRRGGVPRPNGELYYPRRLAGGTDVDVLRRLRNQDIPVLLYGPPGTGKTAMVEAAFPDLLTVAGTGDTIVDDFLGTYTPLPDSGGYEFVHGPLVTAMRQGRPLLVDDATLIPPKVLSVLYPVMDGRGVVHIPAHRNERVEVVDGFYLIAGHNPGVHGAVLTEALASRFAVHIHVTTDWDLARRLGVPAPAVAAAVDLNNDLAADRLSWAPQLREMLGFNRVRKALGLPAAVANLAGRAPEQDRQQVIAALAKHFNTTVTALAVGQQRRP